MQPIKPKKTKCKKCQYEYYGVRCPVCRTQQFPLYPEPIEEDFDLDSTEEKDGYIRAARKVPDEL